MMKNFCRRNNQYNQLTKLNEKLLTVSEFIYLIINVYRTSRLRVYEVKVFLARKKRAVWESMELILFKNHESLFLFLFFLHLSFRRTLEII